MTHLLTVRDVRRPRAFCADLLGGRVVIEENSCIVRLANSWVIMNPGGGPTPDKPDVQLVPYEASGRASSFVNLRVADIDGSRNWLDRLVESRLVEQVPAGGEAGRAGGR